MKYSHSKAMAVFYNEFDKAIWETFEKNFPKTMLDKRSIREVPSDEIPDCDGIVGGPPCQSWSVQNLGYQRYNLVM
jgi:DNA (cytosine-5)-methyltransferase 1